MRRAGFLSTTASKRLRDRLRHGANSSPQSRGRAHAREAAGNQRPWPADKVERWAIDRLIPYAKNARTHSDAQIAAIAASIKDALDRLRRGERAGRVLDDRFISGFALAGTAEQVIAQAAQYRPAQTNWGKFAAHAWLAMPANDRKARRKT